MRRQIVAGNWKMNGNQAFVREFLDQFLANVDGLNEATEVILAVPSVLVGAVVDASAKIDVSVAAQNVSSYDAGAYTGEISAAMLSDFGLRYCLIGHSERRQLFGETDSDIVAKAGRLFGEGIAPILCVGESLEQRESGQADQVVTAQVEAVLSAYEEEQLASLVVAYEPVWAIGTGKTATPEQAQAMHEVIRAVIAKKSQALAERCPILYGGSVNAASAEALFGQPDIDGGLVGGASLKAEEFTKICESIG